MSAEGIELLPSGRYRLRIQWNRRPLRGVFPTLAEAVATRDAVLRELHDGNMVHRDDVDGVCGLARISNWPHGPGVYFCAVPYGGRVKIGSASDIARRLGELRCAAPDLVLLARSVGGLHEERALHARFAHLREAGEWFRLEREMVAFIRSLRASR